MPRLPRYNAPGFPQHVIQRGNNRCACFAVDQDYRFFRDCLSTACEKHGCRIHAYVFMTNHVHLLMTPSTESGIGQVMQSVGRRYVGHFNSTYGRTGTLWEGRYKATVVETESYLFACYRYIELPCAPAWSKTRGPFHGRATEPTRSASATPWFPPMSTTLGSVVTTPRGRPRIAGFSMSHSTKPPSPRSATRHKKAGRSVARNSAERSRRSSDAARKPRVCGSRADAPSKEADRECRRSFGASVR